MDRSLRSGAIAVGAKVEIRTLPGYLPITVSYELEEVFRSNSYSLYGEDQCLDIGHQTGSPDFGDISHIMPGIHPFTVGASGGHHTMDWRILDDNFKTEIYDGQTEKSEI